MKKKIHKISKQRDEKGKQTTTTTKDKFANKISLHSVLKFRQSVCIS